MLRKRKQSQTQNSENVATNVSNTEPQGNLGMNAGPLNQARSSRNRTAKVTYDPSTENGCPSSRSPDPLAQGRLAASRRGNSSPSPSRKNQQADEENNGTHQNSTDISVEENVESDGFCEEDILSAMSQKINFELIISEKTFSVGMLKDFRRRSMV